MLDSQGSLIGMHLLVSDTYSKNLKSSEILTLVEGWGVPVIIISASCLLSASELDTKHVGVLANRLFRETDMQPVRELLE